MKYIDSLYNKIVKKNIDLYLIYAFVILFILKNTILLNNNAFTIGCLLLMLFSFIFCLINYKKILNKFFIFTNIEVILFLIVQLFIIIVFKFSANNISVFINECFFMLIVYLVLIKDKIKYYKVLKFSIYIICVINFISVISGILSYYNIISYCPFSYSTTTSIVGIYSNPNSMGILTILSLIIYCSFFFNKKKAVSYLFLTFSLIIIYFCGCRTVLFVIPFYIIFYLIINYFTRYSRKLITICVLSMITILGCYYSYIYFNRNTVYLNKYENKVNQVLTHRYMLSKYSVLSLENKFLIGINHSEIATKRFKKIPNTIKREMYYWEIQLIHSNNNIHNSYSQILVNQGLIILVLFLLVIIIGLYKTNRKNIPILLTILIISFFESQLLISKDFIMFIFIFILGYRGKDIYIPNCNSVLYINYVDLNTSYSGSVVRPQKIYQAFINQKYDVKMLTGTILRSKKATRIKNIKLIENWLKKNKPLFCYIESPGEPIIYKKDRNLIRLIHDYNIPCSYFYRDCYYLFPQKYVFEDKNVNLKSIVKYFINLLQYTRDNILIKNNIDIVYFPSLSMSKYFNFKNNGILPPGCEICNIDSSGNDLIYVGALSENYGTDLLLDTVEEINKKQKIKLILICRENEYKNYSLKYGNKQWLEVHHVSGKMELEKYYKKAKVALLPKKDNKYNNFAISVKFFEYCGYGLPIIATDSYETTKIIKKYNIGIITDEDSKQFADAIKSVYSNEKKYFKLKENVKKFAKLNTWDNRVHKIEKDLKDGGYYE